MKISMPITKKRIQTHFHYTLWIYILVIALAFLGWNLIHTVTRYQSPNHLKVEWFFGGVQLDDGTAAEALMEKAHTEALPGMEEVTFRPIILDEMNGAVMLTTWAVSGEGDLYTLPASDFVNMMTGGAMMNLQPYVDSGAINLDGIDLTGCYVVNPDTGETWLCGVPMSAMPAIADHQLYCDNSYACILINGGNDENTVKLLSWLLHTCGGPEQPQFAEGAPAADAAQPVTEQAPADMAEPADDAQMAPVSIAPLAAATGK